MIQRGYSFLLLAALSGLIWMSYRPVLANDQRQEMLSVEERLLSRNVDQVVETVRPDGSVEIDFLDGFSSVSVARVTSDGRMESACVTTVEALRAFQKSGSPSSSHPTK